ncbi:MAG TPA: hypothetical protein VGK52_15850 [Polyangia bacterium]|jgi:hypothetical protein
MIRRSRTRLFAAVLLLPLVAFATATSGFALRCRITGAVLGACCCDHGETTRADAVATVSQADCCDPVIRNVLAAPVELTASPSAVPHQTAPVAFVASVDSTADHDPSALSPRSEARASIGPLTVRLRLVAKSTFLI